jgi:hypothetical protein
MVNESIHQSEPHLNHKHTWINLIVMDFEDENWIYLTQDRTKLWSFVNTAMNILYFLGQQEESRFHNEDTDTQSYIVGS